VSGAPANDAAPPSPARPIPLPKLAIGGDGVVSGRYGMVVSVEEHATRAGVAILEAGGNAADAIVATAYALAVTHPSAGNLGGGGFLLYRPHGGPTVAIDFREKAPRATTQALFDKMIRDRAVGAEAAAVPGSVAGLNLTLAKFGRLDRKAVLAPAIALALHGFPLGAWQSKTIEWAWSDLSKDRAAREIFGNKGAPTKPGTLLVQRELARTLSLIADQGDAGFYAGETAAKLELLAKRGGLIRAEDLAAYEAVIREPLRTTYRGFDVEVAPPPSAGGVAVAVMLRLLEKLGAAQLPPLSADEIHLFAEVAKRAHAIRRFEVVDPDSVPGYDLSREESRWLDVDRVLAGTPPIRQDRATPSSEISPFFGAASKELEHTTHLAAVDSDGNVAVCTTTLSASFGAKVMAAGFVLNNSLAAFGTAGRNVLAPERRMTASMSPTLVLAGGTPVLLLGTPGGDTIPNTVVRVLRNVVDYGMTIDRAVDAPRIHHGFVPDEIRYERAHPPPRDVLAALTARGDKLSATTLAFGDANTILLEDGVAYGYVDRRESGLALGPAGPPQPKK
jgi:gamma-glutamyltranspeptidase/glutathione hydrolase